MRLPLRLWGLGLVTLVAVSGVARAQDTARPDPDSALVHVRTLADDRYQGRRAGSPESDSAAAYIARRFAVLGLEPIATGSAARPARTVAAYFQTFPITLGLRVEPKSSLQVKASGRTAALALGREWLPLEFASAGRARGPAIFSAPTTGTQERGETGRDLVGRVVVIEVGASSDPHGGSGAASIRRDATAARDRGASAVIALVPELKPLPQGEPLQSLGIPAVQVLASAFPALPRNGTDLPIDLDLRVSAVQSHTSNVIGALPGRDPALAREIVVVGAHYDHLGLGGSGSLASEPGAIHNGADDNASGVATLLESARILARGPRPQRSVVFIAFAAEEMGLLGSAYYVHHPVVPLEQTVGMMNLDMVGRLSDGRVQVLGSGTAQEFPAILETHGRELGLALSLSPDGYGPSDQTSFYAAGIPVLHFFTGTHEDYHRPSDDWEKINADGLARIAELTVRVVREIASAPARPTYVAQAPPAARGGGDGYGAYLGTIPDFGEVEGGGVRITGVRAGSPAEKAGLTSGDVILRFNDRTIANLYDLTYALRAHAPGDTVQLVVRRGEKQLTFTAILAKRP